MLIDDPALRPSIERLSGVPVVVGFKRKYTASWEVVSVQDFLNRRLPLLPCLLLAHERPSVAGDGPRTRVVHDNSHFVAAVYVGAV